jgi:hypothetical protein
MSLYCDIYVETVAVQIEENSIQNSSETYPDPFWRLFELFSGHKVAWVNEADILPPLLQVLWIYDAILPPLRIYIVWA